MGMQIVVYNVDSGILQISQISLLFLPSFYMLISQSSDTTNYNAWDEDIAMVKVNQQYFFLSIDI